MSEKRKDAKGRVLQTEESQRKDLTYQYWYTDIRGKRQTIYASDLKELREKEKGNERYDKNPIYLPRQGINPLCFAWKRHKTPRPGLRFTTDLLLLSSGMI